MVKAATKKSTYQLVPFKGAALSWFWNTVWRYKGFYIESMMAAVVANVLTLAAVFFAMNVYDRVVPTQAYTSLWTLAIGTTVAILLEFGGALAQGQAGRSGGSQSRSESERHAAARDHGHPTGTPPAIHWHLRQLDAGL